MTPLVPWSQLLRLWLEDSVPDCSYCIHLKRLEARRIIPSVNIIRLISQHFRLLPYLCDFKFPFYYVEGKKKCVDFLPWYKWDLESQILEYWTTASLWVSDSLLLFFCSFVCLFLLLSFFFSPFLVSVDLFFLIVVQWFQVPYIATLYCNLHESFFLGICVL